MVTAIGLRWPLKYGKTVMSGLEPTGRLAHVCCPRRRILLDPDTPLHTDRELMLRSVRGLTKPPIRQHAEPTTPLSCPEGGQQWTEAEGIAGRTTGHLLPVHFPRHCADHRGHSSRAVSQ